MFVVIENFTKTAVEFAMTWNNIASNVCLVNKTNMHDTTANKNTVANALVNCPVEPAPILAVTWNNVNNELMIPIAGIAPTPGSPQGNGCKQDRVVRLISARRTTS